MHSERFGFEYRADHLDSASGPAKHLARRHHQTAAGDHPELDSRAAEDIARDPAPVDGSTTHHARLGAGVERGGRHRRGVERATRLADKQQLGVPAWVRFGDGTVLCRQTYGAVNHQQRAKRFVAVAYRLFGQSDTLSVFNKTTANMD